MIRVVGVRFRNNGRIYYFDPGELEIVPGDGVIVETARGAEFGDVPGPIAEVEDSFPEAPRAAFFKQTRDRAHFSARA